MEGKGGWNSLEQVRLSKIEKGGCCKVREEAGASGGKHQELTMWQIRPGHWD